MGEKEIIHLLHRYKGPKLEGLILLLHGMRIKKPGVLKKKTPKKKTTAVAKKTKRKGR
jgi:hypothetical protein